MHDIETTFYSHAQGMIANTNLNFYNVMSPCLQLFCLIYIMSYLFVAPSPYLWVPFFCATHLICTHLGGGAIFVT